MDRLGRWPRVIRLSKGEMWEGGVGEIDEPAERATVRRSGAFELDLDGTERGYSDGEKEELDLDVWSILAAVKGWRKVTKVEVRPPFSTDGVD